MPEFTTFGQAASIADSMAIAELLDGFQQAWGGQDVPALRALHADDVDWINAYARMFRGKEGLGRFLRERLFPQ